MLPFSRDVWKPVVAACVAAVATTVAVALAPVGGAFAAMLAAAVVAAVYPAMIWKLGLSEEDLVALRSLRLRARDRTTRLDGDQAGFASDG